LTLTARLHKHTTDSSEASPIAQSTLGMEDISAVAVCR